MVRQCRACESRFVIDESDIAFYGRVAPQIGERKFQLPPPALCPSCRHRRRLAWRNERTLYRRNCALSGQSIVSQYNPTAPLKVCARAKWLEVDNTEFGREFDFSRPFFEQFAELFRDTYKANVIQ